MVTGLAMHSRLPFRLSLGAFGGAGIAGWLAASAPRLPMSSDSGELLAKIIGASKGAITLSSS